MMFKEAARSRNAILVWLLLLSAAFNLPVFADEPSEKSLDLALVVDLSGSMKSRDGEDRYGELFDWVKILARPTDRVGVVTLGTGAQVAAPLASIDKLSVESLHDVLSKREKFSNIAAGLENAYYMLKNENTPDRRKVIVLYSDAKIDLPGDEWESRNSMRYLIESLYASLKADDVRVIAVVPKGLDANFPLLQELSSGTGGDYYRGIPTNISQVRRTMSAVALSPKVAATSESTDANPSSPKSAIPHSAVVPSTNNAAPIQPSVVERVVESRTPWWMIVMFAVFGFVLLAVLGGVVYLFRRRGQSSDESSPDELNSVLNEVHALKQLTAERRISAAAEYAAADDEELTATAIVTAPETEDETERLSARFVSPFVEFEDTQSKPAPRMTDDIAVKPAFGTAVPMKDDADLSISNMETLLGMAGVDVERERD